MTFDFSGRGLPSFAEVEDRLYFAYGSNMSERQMKSRVPGAVLVGRATLADHELIFSGFSKTWGGATANVRRKPGSSVFGVVWALPPGGKAQLDRFEGYPTVYQRRKASVVLLDARRTVTATLYYKRSIKALAPPSEAYVALILSALRKHRAP